MDFKADLNSDLEDVFFTEEEFGSVAVCEDKQFKGLLDKNFQIAGEFGIGGGIIIAFFAKAENAKFCLRKEIEIEGDKYFVVDISPNLKRTFRSVGETAMMILEER